MVFFAYLCSFQCRTPGRNNNSSSPEAIRCLDAHLMTVVLKGYRSTNSDIEFVNFFALNARVLKLMILVVENYYDDEFLAKQSQKLQLDNRASSGAKFHFTTDDIKRNCWGIRSVHDLYLFDP
jgi:hypothetical protein